MNFSKLSPSGEPLWWLLFKGEKFKTRRPPPCKNCGKKWWLHVSVMEGADLKAPMMKCDGNPKHYDFYEPDLSRWQSTKWKHINEKGEYDAEGAFLKQLAICPGRGKAAICKHCGGWKEWHGNMNTIVGQRDYFVASKDTICYGTLWMKNSLMIKVCSNYEPLRLMVVKVEMESEWLKREIVKLGSATHEISCTEAKIIQNTLHKDEAEIRGTGMLKTSIAIDNDELIEFFEKEARAEGGQNATWDWLQDALYGKGGYPKGTPMAVIEFERRVRA